MKEVKELYARLNNTKHFREKYPDFNMEDNKIHVLFLSPCLNETGYYRMILPALELNRTDTHRAIVSHIHKWDFSKQFDDYDSPIEFRLVEWADYVVLPAMFTDVEYIIRNMREVNDDIEFVMDLDVNYHELPDYNPDFSKVHQSAKDMLLRNLSRVDILTAPNHLILNYYNSLIQKHGQDFLLYFESYPNLLSSFTVSEIKEIKRNPGPKVRVGIIAEATQVGDVRTIVKPLADILEKYKDQAELIIFGWSRKIGEQHDLFKGLAVTYEKPELFTFHNEILNLLRLDIGLIPLADNPYNRSGKSINRYLDFSACRVPVIASGTQPFRKVISEGENGFIATTEEEWVTKIEKLITDPALRMAVGEHAFSFVWENMSYNARSIQRLKSVFV
jgi:glycosyltransferase involved in cell wall biosynthesis